jgi:hypothetical protein
MLKKYGLHPSSVRGRPETDLGEVTETDLKEV